MRHKNTTVLMFIALGLICPLFAHAAVENIRVITFGDSITAGLIRTIDSGTSAQCHSGVALDESLSGSGNLRCFGKGREGVGGYQPSLKSSIAELGYNVLVYNWGFSGIRTDEMNSRTSSVLGSQPSAQYVLILGGANDAFSGVSSSTVRFNLQSIVNKTCNANRIPIIGTITPFLGGGSVSSKINNYNARIRNDISASSNCGLIKAEQFNALNASSSFFGSDGLHLSNSGNSRMAEVWFDAMNLSVVGVGFIGAVIMLLLDDDEVLP